MLGFTKHVQSTVSRDIHLTAHLVLLLIKFFLLQSLELQRGSSSGCHALLLSLFLAEHGRLCQTLLVDFRHKWVTLFLGLPQVAFSRLLLFVLGSLIFECILVEHLVLALPRIQAIRIALVILQLAHHRGLSIISPYSLVFNLDFIDTALVDQSIVLIVTNLSLFSSFELLPSLLFDHGCVRVQVLPLQSDLLQFLRQAGLFLSLLLFFLLNLAVRLQEALLPSSLRPRRQNLSIILFLKPLGIVLSLSPVAGLFNLLGFFHQLGSLLLLSCQVGLAFEFHLLFCLSFIELETLSQLSDGHLLHQTMATSLSWIKTLGPLDGDLFKLANLSNQLSLLGKICGFLILLFLESFLNIAVHLVSNRFVFLLLKNYLLSRGVLVCLHLSDDFFLLNDELLNVQLALIHHHIHLRSHLVYQLMVLLFFVLSGEDGLFPCQLHLNLFLLDVLEALNLILLIHLSLPTVELGRVLQAHSHLLKFLLLFSFLKVNQVLLSFESGNVELDVSVLFFEVGHLSRLNAIEFELSDYLLLHFLFDTIDFLNCGSRLSSESKSLLIISFIFAFDGIDCRLTTLFLIVFNICKSLFVHVLWKRPGLDLSFDLLRRWDHLGLWLCQVEGLKLSFFRLLLLFAAV